MSPSRVERIASPLGEMLLVTDEEGTVFALEWDSEPARLEGHLSRAWGELDLKEVPARSDPAERVRKYFEGDLGALDAIRAEPAGTNFQRSVWAALRQIPVGRTCSYGELARRIEAPRAVRAVGLANGKNPASLICPCHRVIGSDGSLTGYGGGLERKAWLLDHEGARPRERDLFSSLSEPTEP